MIPTAFRSSRVSPRFPVLSVLALPVFAAAVSGCGPMWYGAPPAYPPGHGLPPTQIQQPTVVPGNPAPLQVPPDKTPEGTGTPPSTFQSAAPAGSLNDVPDASAGQVLTMPTPRSTSTYHDVQPGETLSGIARKYGVTLDALKAANVFDNDPVLKPGDLILIP